MTAAELANLKTTRTNFISQLATESASPKPSYQVGNQRFDWPAYYAWLHDAIERVNSLIKAEEDGAWEVRSQLRS